MSELSTDTNQDGKTAFNLDTIKNKSLTARINAIQSGLALDDLKCIFDAKNTPKCLFIPKTDEFDQIKWLFENINALSNEKFNFFFYMESAMSLLNMRNLLENSINLSKEKYNSKYLIEGVVFGSDDYCADIVAARSSDALVFARQYLVTVCKAFRLQCVDMVFINFKGTRIENPIS
jgi:citrate lyase subunit beta-like protein